MYAKVKNPVKRIKYNVHDHPLLMFGLILVIQYDLQNFFFLILFI